MEQRNQLHDEWRTEVVHLYSLELRRPWWSRKNNKNVISLFLLFVSSQLIRVISPEQYRTWATHRQKLICAVRSKNNLQGLSVKRSIFQWHHESCRTFPISKLKIWHTKIAIFNWPSHGSNRWLELVFEISLIMFSFGFYWRAVMYDRDVWSHWLLSATPMSNACPTSHWVWNANFFKYQINDSCMPINTDNKRNSLELDFIN